MEQKKEYKRLEIEIIGYEYEDVITASGIETPPAPMQFFQHLTIQQGEGNYFRPASLDYE